MNRYAAAGLAAAAADGRRILVVSRNQTEAYAAFRDIEAATTDATRINRANGKQRIVHPSGGVVRFTSPLARGGRGLSVDTVYIDSGADLSPDRLAELQPCIAASPTGEIIRA